MSSANETQVLIAPETTFGTAPTVPVTWETVRMTGETLSGTPDTVVSNEIRADRMTSGSVATSLTVGGDTNGEMSAVTWDVALEAVVGGTWTGNVLKIGSIERSFTILKNFLDVSTGAFIRLRGMKANSFTIGMNAGEIMTAAVNYVGSQVDASDTTYVDGTDTINPATTTLPFNSTSDITSIKLDDVDVTGCIQSLSLPIDNQMRGSQCLGFYGNKSVLYSSQIISSPMSILLNSIDLYQNILANSFHSFEFTVGDLAGNSYRFLRPRVQFTGPAPTAEAIDTDVVQNITMNAHVDPAENSNIVITRTLV